MLTIKYFTAGWCAPCKAFGPVFDQVMSETGIEHSKLDIESSSRKLAVEMNVTSIPTLIFEVNGNEVHRQTGAMSRGQLLELIQRFS